VKADFRSSVATTPGQQREGAVVQFHHHALQGLQRRGNFQQLQDHRLIGTQHAAGSDAESHGVADVASSAGDDNANGLISCVCSFDVSGNNGVAWKKPAAQWTFGN
jgi:hypothetical protein